LRLSRGDALAMPRGAAGASRHILVFSPAALTPSPIATVPAEAGRVDALLSGAGANS
jgi:hypothetical protein